MFPICHVHENIRALPLSIMLPICHVHTCQTVCVLPFKFVHNLSYHIRLVTVRPMLIIYHVALNIHGRRFMIGIWILYHEDWILHAQFIHRRLFRGCQVVCQNCCHRHRSHQCHKHYITSRRHHECVAELVFASGCELCCGCERGGALLSQDLSSPLKGPI